MAPACSRAPHQSRFSPRDLLNLLGREIALSQKMLGALEESVASSLLAGGLGGASRKQLQMLDRLSQRLGDLAALAVAAEHQLGEGDMLDLPRLLGLAKLEEIRQGLNAALPASAPCAAVER